jgi:uncharacterized protein (DUF1800 family)
MNQALYAHMNNKRKMEKKKKKKKDGSTDELRSRFHERFIFRGSRQIHPRWILFFNNKLLNQFTKIYLEESKSPHS